MRAIVVYKSKSGLEKQASEIPHFYMQSGLNYEKMNLVEQILMKAFAKIMDKKVGKGSVSSTSFDVSSKEYIVPLIQCVRERENGSKK